MNSAMQPQSQDIADLIARCAMRDRAAFRSLYDRTSAKLFGVVLRILKDRSEAEEAIQEVYVKVWQRADRYVAGGYSPISWLVAVARNHALDILRARRPVSADIDAALEVPDSGPSPERAAEDSDERGRIEHCLGELDPDRAEAVKGAYLDGSSYDELAARYEVAAEYDANLAAPQPAAIERVSDPMSMSEHTGEDEGGRNALVAEYVLGLLDSNEHDRVGRLIDNDQALRRERDFWISRFGALNREYEETPVPAHLFDAIEARAFGDVVRARAASSFWDSLLVWRGIAAGALAVAVIAVGFHVFQPAPDASTLTTQLVAALEEEGSNVKFVALYDGAGNVRLTALSGEAVPEKDFELWAIQGGNNPVSMGVIPVDQRSAVTVPADVMKGLGEGSVLAITLEAKGGSTDGAPHGPIVAKGAVTKI